MNKDFFPGVVVIVSVVLAFVALQTLEFELHQIIGILVLLLLLFHVVLASFRPAPDTRYNSRPLILFILSLQTILPVQ